MTGVRNPWPIAGGPAGMDLPGCDPARMERLMTGEQR